MTGPIPHGTPEWYEARRKLVTASDVPAIMGLIPAHKPIEVFREKLSGKDDRYNGWDAFEFDVETEVDFGKHKGEKWKDIPYFYLRWIVDDGPKEHKGKAKYLLSLAPKRGRDLEHRILHEFLRSRRVTGLVYSPGLHVFNGWLGASPDAYYYDCRGEMVLVEIKAPKKLPDRGLDRYVYQLLTQAFVMGNPAYSYLVYGVENDGKLEIEEEVHVTDGGERFRTEILPRTKAFHDAIRTGILPPELW